jgi:hypothetical protein
MWTTHHCLGTEVLDELNNTQHQLTEVILLCSSSLVHFAGRRRFCVERQGAGQPFVIFQIILTVEFLILIAFAAHLTDYLNSRCPAYSILHAC